MNTTSNIKYALNREKGQFPISIATSLALESLLNIHPDTKHNSIPIVKYQTLWVNVRTLFRNLYTAMERADAERCSVGDLVFALNEEIERLLEWSKMGEVNLPIRLYHSKYEIEKLYPYAKFRSATTPIQLRYQKAMALTINQLFKEKILIDVKSNNGNTYVFKDLIDPGVNENALILTHYGYDLLRDYGFAKLTLLESHTGNIKPKSQWYSKYHKGKELPPMPFLIELMQVLGDKEMFKQMPRGVRQFIINLANKYSWTPQTTKSRVLQGIKLSKELDYQSIILPIFNTRMS